MAWLAGSFRGDKELGRDLSVVLGRISSQSRPNNDHKHRIPWLTSVGWLQE